MGTPHLEAGAKCDIDNPLNPTLTTRIILNQIDGRAAEKWKTLGQQLRIAFDTIQRIETEQPHLKGRLMDLIHHWLTESNLQCTWRKLINALRAIHEVSMADEIERQVRNGEIESNKRPWSLTDDADTYFEQIQAIQEEIRSAVTRTESHVSLPESTNGVEAGTLEPAIEEIKREVQYIEQFLYTTIEELLEKMQEYTHPLQLATLTQVVEGSQNVKRLKETEIDEKERLHRLLEDGRRATTVTAQQEKLRSCREKIENASGVMEKWEKDVLKHYGKETQRILVECAQTTISCLNNQLPRLHTIRTNLIQYIDALKEEKVKLEEPIKLLEAKLNHRYTLPMYYAARGFEYSFYNPVNILWVVHGAISGCWQAMWGGSEEDRAKLDDLNRRENKIAKLVTDCETYAEKCLELCAECKKYCITMDTAKSFLVQARE